VARQRSSQRPARPALRGFLAAGEPVMVVYGGMGKRGGRVPGVQVVHIRAAGRGLRQREAAASIWIMTAAARLRGCAKCKGAGERC
jgi:hypothetical protein